MKLAVSKEWVMDKIANDPDLPCGVGNLKDTIKKLWLSICADHFKEKANVGNTLAMEMAVACRECKC